MDMLIPCSVQCPHCWESFTLEVDTSQGDHEAVEDCSVCCVPMTLKIACHAGEVDSIQSEP